ncbi:MAG: phosphomannomutase/phosphoglucomutase [Aridibacter sp.]
MNQQIFREYDIRGLVGIDLTEESVKTLAHSIGTYFKQNNVKRVSIGYDARESSPIFSEIFNRAMNDSGLDVLNIGLVPTPLLYFTLFTEDVDGGVMITGSHNPAEFNGLKLCLNKTTLHGEQIQEIKEIALAGKFSDGEGEFSEKDILPDYLEFVKENILPGNRKLKVIVDSGNVVGGIVGVPLYKMLGFEVIDIFTEPDSSFPNHHPDPTVAENMEDAISALKKNDADLAIAFDGDGDRIVVVDENGKIIWGDELMTIFSRSILEEKPDATFIAEVKCSQRLFDDIEKRGGKIIMWKVGHSLIKAKMNETGAALAGEMSGHIFFADRYFGFDDAIYSGARLLEILSHTDKNLSELIEDLPEVFNTPEIRIDCKEEKKFEIVKYLTEKFKKTNKVIDIDGVRILFDKGWGLVRASNTQPVLVLRFEAESEEALEHIQKTVETEVYKLL